MELLNEVVEKICFIREKNYKGTSIPKLKIDLKEGITFKVNVSSEDLQLISAVKLFTENPIKKFDLVKDVSAESGTEYYCVICTLNDEENTQLKYFFGDFVKTKIVIEKLLKYYSNKKNIENKNNAVQEKIK